MQKKHLRLIITSAGCLLCQREQRWCSEDGSSPNGAFNWAIMQATVKRGNQRDCVIMGVGDWSDQDENITAIHLEMPDRKSYADYEYKKLSSAGS